MVKTHVVPRPASEAAAEPARSVSPAVDPTVALSDLPTGSLATLSSRDLAEEDRRMLGAMGLSDRAPVRICRQGEPCIVEVRSTRVGLTRAVAALLRAEPRPLLDR